MDNSNKKQLAIIGFGQFGKFIAKILKPHFKITATSKSDYSVLAKKMGIKFASLQETVQNADIIILTMPISVCEEIVKKISSSLKKGALVIDTCSVKTMPSYAMKKYLPQDMEIIASHPLFGPQSGKNGIKGLKIIIWPIRIKKENYKKVKRFLKLLGLEIIEMSPEEHDKTIALFQALTHFVSKGIVKLNLPSIKFLTPSSLKLLSAVSDVKDDSESLFYDMQKFNPYAKKTRENFVKILTEINKKIK